MNAFNNILRKKETENDPMSKPGEQKNTGIYIQ